MVHPYLRRREGPRAPVEYPQARSWSASCPRPSASPCSRNRPCRSPSSAPASPPARRTSSAAPWPPSSSPAASSNFKDKLIERHGRPRLRPRVRRDAPSSQIRGLRQLRLPRKPRRQLRHHCLRLLLGEVPPPRHLLLPPCSTAQPMGFYAPAQVVRCARDHGVQVRFAIDVNHSRWDCTLEAAIAEADVSSRAPRPPKMAKGLVRGPRHSPSSSHRGEHPYTTIEELWRRAAIARPPPSNASPRPTPTTPSMRADRRGAIWAIRALRRRPPAPLRRRRHRAPAKPRDRRAPRRTFAPMRPGRTVVEDYASRRPHPPPAPRQPSSARTWRNSRHGPLRRPRSPCRDGRRVIVRRPRPRPPEARLRQGRHVHHHRGRDRHCQPHPLAQHLRTPTPPRADVEHDGRPWQGAEGERRQPT